MAKKVELKTKQNKASVSSFLNTIEDPQKRKDCKEISKLMKAITGKKPTMWGSSIVGFDTYDYTYASGRSGTWFIVGFSPRKQNITIYIMPGYKDYGTLLDKLGPHKIGKSCIYIKSLEHIHLPTLKKIITSGYKDMKEKYS